MTHEAAIFRFDVDVRNRGNVFLTSLVHKGLSVVLFSARVS